MVNSAAFCIATDELFIHLVTGYMIRLLRQIVLTIPIILEISLLPNEFFRLEIIAYSKITKITETNEAKGE